MHYPVLFLLLFLQSLLFGEKIPTFYGTLDIEEPVILELIHSPPLQRLKSIHQYGVAYYTSHKEEYNRFDHTLGVFALLRLKGAPLEEQVAGLLHDSSHTVFSHVGDWVFGREQQEDDYHNIVFKFYVASSGLETILLKHGFTIDQISPKRKEFCRLEQPLPNLCADRLDYNIQGAYFQGFLTKEEALLLAKDVEFIEGKWMTTNVDLTLKLARFSLYMTENCWGNAFNYASSRYLADAILQGFKIGLLSWEEFHFGVDNDVWNKLQQSSDPLIQENFKKVLHTEKYCKIVDRAAASKMVTFRCRGIDPWIRGKNGQEAQRLSSLNKEFAQELASLKEKASSGWPIKME